METVGGVCLEGKVMCSIWNALLLVGVLSVIAGSWNYKSGIHRKRLHTNLGDISIQMLFKARLLDKITK